MGLYTQLKGPQNVIPEGNINLYDLAIQTGSTPEEAELLSQQPDAQQFLEAKWRRMQMGEKGRVPPGGPQIGAPKESFDMGAGLQQTLSNIGSGLGRAKDIALGNIDVPQQDVGMEQFKAAQAQNVPEPNREDILALVDRMREQEAGRQGAVPGGPGIPTPADTAPARARALPGTAEITDPGEPNKTGMSPKTKAALLDLMSGLTEAGRRVGAAPSYYQLFHGSPQREFEPETKLSGEAERIRGEERVKEAEEEAKQKAIEEGKTNPIVKLAKEMGIEAQTEQDAIKAIKAKRALASLGKTEAETEAIEGKTAEREADAAARIARARKLDAGQMSAMSKEAKTALANTQKELMNDDIYKLNIKVVDTTSRLRDLLNSGNTMALRGIPVAFARAMGEVGNLSQTEQDVYKKDLGISGEWENWKEWWTSTPSAQRIAKLKQVVDAIEKNSAPKVLDAVRRYAGAYSRLYQEVPEEAIMDHFLSLGTTGSVREATNRGNTVDLILNDGSVKRNVPMSKAKPWIDQKQARIKGQ